MAACDRAYVDAGSLLYETEYGHFQEFAAFRAIAEANGNVECDPISVSIWEANMRLPRRTFLRLVAAAAALPTVSNVAWAQAYPSRPVRLVVATSAGSAPDVIARLIGQWLSERLGQSFVIDNRPGGGGNIGTESVARAPADGYTLLVFTVASAANATLYNKLNYNFLRDIAPVAGLVRIPNVLVVHPSVQAETVPELIAYTKANPSKVNMASAGNGSAPHLAGELFKMMAGVNMVHVPYRGATPAMTDLLAGQVQVMFPTIASSIEYISAGKLRALAVTSMNRWQGLPDVPTVSEFLTGYESAGWFGVGAPTATPAAIVEQLNGAINAALADPKVKAQIIDLGGVPIQMTRADFGKFIAEETEKWGDVIRAANIKPE
jgi:tripartite-type tricarboxylate transporter receptor subunit TctC